MIHAKNVRDLDTTQKTAYFVMEMEQSQQYVICAVGSATTLTRGSAQAVMEVVSMDGLNAMENV